MPGPQAADRAFVRFLRAAGAAEAFPALRLHTAPGMALFAGFRQNLRRAKKTGPMAAQFSPADDTGFGNNLLFLCKMQWFIPRAAYHGCFLCLTGQTGRETLAMAGLVKASSPVTSRIT